MDVIYFTDGDLNHNIMVLCQQQLRTAFPGKIISVSLKPVHFGDVQILVPLNRGYLAYFTQIVAGLEASQAPYVCMAEHDCLYPKEHFDFHPPDKKIYYDHNWYKIRRDGLAATWKADQVSGICASRDVLLEFYKKRLATYDEKTFDRKFEPMSGEGSASWNADVPYVDIRHEQTLTKSKWSLDDFRKKDTAVDFRLTRVEDIPGWDNLDKVIKWN